MPPSCEQSGVTVAWLAAVPSPPPSRHRMGDIVVLVTILIGLAVVGGLLMLAVRRRLLSRERSATHAGMAESLRDMHARGILSTEEYDRVRRSMARSAARHAAGQGGRGPSKSG